MTLKILLRHFPHPLITIPFSIFGLNDFGKDPIKADWQPPGYVFGIAWSILYTLLSVINIRLENLNILDTLKKNALKEGINEALLQGLWLLISSDLSKFGIKKGKIQYIGSFILISYLAYYAFSTRLNTLKSTDITSYYMYIPYVVWISFASILSYQILLKSLK